MLALQTQCALLNFDRSGVKRQYMLLIIPSAHGEDKQDKLTYLSWFSSCVLSVFIGFALGWDLIGGMTAEKLCSPPRRSSVAFDRE